jgi:hypothetical protein
VIVVAWIAIVDFWRPANPVFVPVVLIALLATMFIYRKTLRCPKCGAQFRGRLWMTRKCWHCGVDMSDYELGRLPPEHSN